jgi:hypothetical protein
MVGIRRLAAGRFGFDDDQLAANVVARKVELGLSWKQVAEVTEVAYPHLLHYFAVNPKVPRTQRRVMSAELVVRLLMWLEDYDIRDYLLEER